MAHHQITDFERPDRLAPAQRAEVLAWARRQILDLDPGRDGTLHVSDVLAALDDSDAT